MIFNWPKNTVASILEENLIPPVCFSINFAGRKMNQPFVVLDGRIDNLHGSFQRYANHIKWAINETFGQNMTDKVHNDISLSDSMVQKLGICQDIAGMKGTWNCIAEPQNQLFISRIIDDRQELRRLRETPCQVDADKTTTTKKCNTLHLHNPLSK